MTNPRTPSPSHGRWTGRTRFVTAASIVAVGIAGAVAIGANIGILDAAENNNIGELSAAGDLTDTTPQVVDVYLDGSTGTLDPAAAAVTDPARAGATDAMSERTADGSETFAVDSAGTVTIARTATGLRLEGVAPSAGWTWQLSQTDPSTLTVSFTDGARTLDFTATLGADGSITPDVVETVNEPAGSSTNQSPSHHDDDGDEEHEGREDDD